VVAVFFSPSGPLTGMVSNLFPALYFPFKRREAGSSFTFEFDSLSPSVFFADVPPPPAPPVLFAGKVFL